MRGFKVVVALPERAFDREFDSYAEASAYAKGFRQCDVYILKLTEVAFFKARTWRLPET
jgi:hypothetical protein